MTCWDSGCVLELNRIGVGTDPVPRTRMTTKATLAVASAVAVAGLAVYYRNDCWQRGVLSVFQSPRKTYEDLCDELKALSALGGCKHRFHTDLHSCACIDLQQ
jgi:hypothetical protein